MFVFQGDGGASGAPGTIGAAGPAGSPGVPGVAGPKGDLVRNRFLSCLVINRLIFMSLVYIRYLLLTLTFNLITMFKLRMIS